MTARRWLADTLIETIDRGAKLLGSRFYQLFLDDLNRRHYREGDIVSSTVPMGRLRFHVPNRRTNWRVETLLSKEPSTLRWIEGFEEASVFWDVGANVGLYALYGALARQCTVVAFEPSPANFELLSRNIALNGMTSQIIPVCAALSSARGIGKLLMADPTPGAAFATFAEPGRAGAELRCLGYAIDQFIADFDPPFPNHIKIDVDGTEARILDGATATLRDLRLKSLVIETDVSATGSIASIARMLDAAGFGFVGRFKSPMFPDSPAENHHFARRAEIITT